MSFLSQTLNFYKPIAKAFSIQHKKKTEGGREKTEKKERKVVQMRNHLVLGTSLLKCNPRLPNPSGIRQTDKTFSSTKANKERKHVIPFVGPRNKPEAKKIARNNSRSKMRKAGRV
ncbi:hypothetical protein TNCV_766091 [Trichonephila clavipes]|nr:hypothetical protein TNCV_766091 [Trichonephila clavipes]